MGKKILLGCYEIPGYGGASTAGYALFESMQRDGLEVAFVNIVDAEDVDYFRYVFGESFGNPKRLPQVYNCILSHPLFYPSCRHAELADLIDRLSPDVMIGIDYIAALLMKQSSIERRLIFLTGGCSQARWYISSGKAKDAIGLNQLVHQAGRPPEPPHAREQQAVAGADLILTHSEMTRSFYEYFFPAHEGKIYPEVIWFADWIYQDALDHVDLRRPFSERDIDLIFVASSWTRPEKNLKLLRQIIARCRDLNIHIVGEIRDRSTHATYHSLVTERRALFALMGRAKTLVCPSLLDAAPGILFEAGALGCNVIASKNCGNWRVCNDKLLVDPFCLDGFLEKISLSLAREFPGNLDYYRATDSYRNLVNIAAVF